MNILIITPSLDPEDNISGISSMTRLMISHKKDNNYYPFLLGKKDNEKRDIVWFCNLLKIPFRLLSFIKRKQIEIVHFNIGFEKFSLLRDIIPYTILFYKKIPLCLHIHGGRYVSSRPSLFLRVIISFFLKKSSQIIVLSELEATFLNSNYNKCIIGKLNVLPNAVELSYELSKNYQGILNLLYLGRLDRNKGLSIIAKVLNQLVEKDIKFIFFLCGVGDDKDWFMSLLKSKTIAFVVDQGLVYGTFKNEILKHSHLFLLPSLFEGLPMALLESMGNAVLPIVSPVGSIPEVVVDRKNGFLVKDVDTIVSIITELDNNRELLRNISLEARKTVKLSFSITNYIDKVNEIYFRI